MSWKGSERSKLTHDVLNSFLYWSSMNSGAPDSVDSGRRVDDEVPKTSVIQVNTCNWLLATLKADGRGIDSVLQS